MATRFITISIEIMHVKNLTANQKFILAEIEQLSQLEHGCYAHNQHFADLIGMAKESVSRSIKDLEDKGYISVKITNGSRNHERLLTLNKMLRPPKQNVKTPLTKHQETKENKTTNKTINIQESVTTNSMGAAIRISAYLHAKILGFKPNFKQSTRSWEMDIERAIRLDGRTEQQLVGCIDWIYSTDKGSFWIPNVMSGFKLRQKFDMMEAQIMNSNNKNEQLEKNLKMMEEIRNAI